MYAFSNNTCLLPLDNTIPRSAYCKIDLSESNVDLKHIDISVPEVCEHYVATILERNNAQVAYGGYLEKRNLYATERFSKGAVRNVHLGMDFWCKAGTKVVAPLDGTVHSFKNNMDRGNYGPTIILEHRSDDETYYSLYGHLSVESLSGLELGKRFKQGAVLGTLGETAINVNYAPHLHFQLIKDLQGSVGDYPGVSTADNLEYFKNNCPDPNRLFHL